MYGCLSVSCCPKYLARMFRILWQRALSYSHTYSFIWTNMRREIWCKTHTQYTSSATVQTVDLQDGRDLKLSESQFSTVLLIDCSRTSKKYNQPLGKDRPSNCIRALLLWRFFCWWHFNQRIPPSRPHTNFLILRLQTNRDNLAKYGFIRKRIVPFGMIRIAYQNIRFRLIQNRIWILRFRFKP